ncbi:MAG: hypothetical protein J1F22_02445 [Lachnospiraceae bacterium]|nr:hypothetical protein [Lachnospiraceae bacterium]
MDMTVQNSTETSLQELKNRLEMQKKAVAKAKTKKNAKTKKKKLGYSPTDISMQLMRATRAAGVSMVLLRARSKVDQLQRCAASGQYDEAEIKAALTHAKRIVKCAKKKLRNMENEEAIESKGNKKDTTKNVREEEKLRQMIQRELKKLRRKNRSEENNAIQNANMRYLKEKIREQKREAVMEQMSMETEMSEMPVEAGEGAAAVPTGEAVEAVPVSVDVLI